LAAPHRVDADHVLFGYVFSVLQRAPQCVSRTKMQVGQVGLEAPRPGFVPAVDRTLGGGDERGRSGIRMEPAAAVVRQYKEQFRQVPRQRGSSLWRIGR